jgi:hypothetical protein
MSGYARDHELGITVPIDANKELLPEHLRKLVHDLYSLVLELSIRVPETELKLYADRINRATKIKLAWVGEEKPSGQART